MTQNWSKFVVWADFVLAIITALFFVSLLGADGKVPAIAALLKIVGYVGVAAVAVLHFLAMRQFRLAAVDTTAHYVGFAGVVIAFFSFIFTYGWLGLVATAALVAAGLYVTTSMRGANLHATSAKKTVAVATKVEKETKGATKTNKSSKK